MAPLAPAVRKYRESYVVDFAQQSYNSIAQRAPPAARVSRFHLVLSSRNANLDRVSMSRYLSSARKANHARGDPPPVLCETIFCDSSYSAYEDLVPLHALRATSSWQTPGIATSFTYLGKIENNLSASVSLRYQDVIRVRKCMKDFLNCPWKDTCPSYYEDCFFCF